jgi:hypothetical protein
MKPEDLRPSRPVAARDVGTTLPFPRDFSTPLVQRREEAAP